MAEIATQLQSSLIRLENFQKLTELQRDLIGIENLTAPGRVSALTEGRGCWETCWKCDTVNLTSVLCLQEFIREGCLYKLTKKGLQQRMFFLVSTKPLWLKLQQKLHYVQISVLEINVSLVFSVLRHAPLYKQRCDGHQSVQSARPAASSWDDSEYLSSSSSRTRG